jgi:hypothetical protein
MNIIAFIFLVIAAVIFTLADGVTVRYHRSNVALGLAVFTVGVIVQLCAKSHQITF